ncbi:MAG: serine/threonine-protein kinase, partial [Myxococcota bacterium]
MSASSDDLSHSERRFHIHSCLGRGGFGEVYRALMISPGGLRSEVALKVLRADIDPGSEAVARLRDEGRLLSAIRHPSILHVHDLVVIEGRVALVTEYVEGEDLDRCIVGEPPLSVRALVMALSDVASALDAAWSSPSPITGQPIELVHRDIKPANIRIGRHGEVKLLDFGVARAVDMQREAHTADHAMMGSYLYMAPERFTDDIVEPASDVFALGCVLYEGLARRRYFHGMHLKTIYGIMLSNRKLQAHLDERMAELPPLHEDLDALLRDMLASDPDVRPRAAEAARRGEDLADDLTGSSLKRWARRRAWSDNPRTVTGSLDGMEVVAQAYLAPREETPEPEPRRAARGGLPANVRLTPPPVREKRRAPSLDVDPAPLVGGPPPLETGP